MLQVSFAYHTNKIHRYKVYCLWLCNIWFRINNILLNHSCPLLVKRCWRGDFCRGKGGFSEGHNNGILLNEMVLSPILGDDITERDIVGGDITGGNLGDIVEEDVTEWGMNFALDDVTKWDGTGGDITMEDIVKWDNIEWDFMMEEVVTWGIAGGMPWKMS